MELTPDKWQRAKAVFDAALQQAPAFFFTSGKPRGQKKHGGDLRDFRWLKGNWAEADPAP